MSFTQDFRTQRRNYSDGETRIGEKDRLWYDSGTNSIRIGDGVTPGGVIVGGSGGGGDYVLPTASATVRGGVKIGSNITITDGVISVAAPFSGSYNDLTDKPTIPSLTGYATESFVTSQGYLTSVGTISYNDLSNKPTLFSGSYTDLTNKPTLFDGAYASLTGKPTLFSGSYDDLTNKPTIPSLTGYATETYVTTRGYLTSYTETDPVFAASAAAGITSTDISNWGTAYGWGNHADAGYLTSVGTITTLQWTASEFFPSAPAASTVTAGDGTVDINLETGIPGSTTSVNWAFTNQGTIEFPDGTTQTSAYTGDSSTTEALTIGTGLSGTSFNGSTAVTIALEDNYGDTKNPYASKTAKYFLAAPNAANGSPTFRAIVASDIPTLNQNTTGSAATLTTARSINGVSFNGSADITVTAAAGTLTGTTLASGVTASSLTSVGTLNGLTVNKSTTGTALSITASNAAPYGGTATWQFVGNGNIGGAGSWIQFPDSSVQTTAYTGNAATVTNGVYTTDTGTVTNTMLAGSIANNKLANSSITINGSSTALGGSVTITTITGNAGTATKLATARAINGVDFDGSAAITVTAAAGTLTGTTLNSSVVSSSLTSVGTLTNLTVAGSASVTNNSATDKYLNIATTGQLFDDGNFHIHAKTGNMWINTLDSSNIYIGLQYNSGSGSNVISNTPHRAKTSWNSAIDTEITVDDYRFRISNSGGIFPQVISNTGGNKNSAWTVVAARSGSAITQTGSTGTLVPNNSWTSLYTSGGMDSAGDTYVATLQDKNEGRIYRITFMRSDNGSTTGYNIIAERLL